MYSNMFRWGRAANEEARAKREARLVEIGDIKNIPVRIHSCFYFLFIKKNLFFLFETSFKFSPLHWLYNLKLSTKVGKISDVAANVSIGYQPEVHTRHIVYWSLTNHDSFCLKVWENDMIFKDQDDCSKRLLCELNAMRKEGQVGRTKQTKQQEIDSCVSST